MKIWNFLGAFHQKLAPPRGIIFGGALRNMMVLVRENMTRFKVKEIGTKISERGKKSSDRRNRNFYF